MCEFYISKYGLENVNDKYLDVVSLIQTRRKNI